MNEVEKLLTVDELSELLQIGKTTIWKWRKEGLPHIKYGKNVRFDGAKVIEWLEKNGKK